MLFNKPNIIATKKIINDKMILFKNRKLKILYYAFTIIFLDQLSKFLILNKLGFEKSINIIPNLLNFTLVKNKGAAFSLFNDSTTILAIISVLASFLIVIFILKSLQRSYWNSIGLAYLLGGTVGNGIDRVIKGYVVDFLEIVPINFPIFNFADISINIAVIFFIIDIVRTKYKSKY
tara:strand:- start:1366 stop:1896 length:531 start_codon:yes stop_codon:yes gene_type:complete